jgi:hypothetical protein
VAAIAIDFKKARAAFTAAVDLRLPRYAGDVREG